MDRRLRIGLRVAGIVAIAAAFTGVALMFHLDSKVAGSVVARPLDWIVPTAAVFSLAGAAWLLLGELRPDRDVSPFVGGTRCPSCHKEVPGTWRICPYCGEMPGRERSATSATDQQGGVTTEGGSP